MEPPAPARRVIVIDKPDAVQTEIRVGQLAIPRKHPDYLPWDLAVRVLGGEGANRLHGVLRSERGLTYGASAEIDARREAGDFVAETDTRTETTGEALRIIRDELVRLQRDPVSTRELSGAQAYLAGSFPLTIETPNDIAVQVLNAVFYELPLTEIGTFHTRVVSVTPDDVQRVARQYIRPDRLSVVLVGNAKAFVPQLRAAGFPDFEVIPLGDLDLGSPTLSRTRIRVSNETPLELAAAERLTGPRWILASAVQTAAPQTAAPRPAPTPARPSAPAAPAPAQPSSVQARTESAGSDLLRRVIDARGGLEALKAVRSVVADADTVFLSERGDEAVRSTTKTYVLYPDKVRIDATIQGSAVSQILNGGRAWEVGPAGLRDLPPAARDEAAASVRRDTISLLVAAAEGRLSARAFSLDGQRVLEISGTNLDPVRLVIDAQDAILKQRYSTRGPTGKPVSQEEAFADYRIVSGVRMPFQASVLQDGRPIVRRTLTKVVINGPMDPSIFDRPREALK
jgi:hypothetical protein